MEDIAEMRDRVLNAIALLGGINFVAFLVMDIVLGGDALGGKVENGRYFLGNHGTFHEVSHAVFVYSACHAYSALLGLALAGFIGKRLDHDRSVT